MPASVTSIFGSAASEFELLSLGSKTDLDRSSGGTLLTILEETF